MSKDITYVFSQEDINNLNEKLNKVRDLVTIIDELDTQGHVSSSIYEKSEEVEDALILIDALISARVNKN